jgi:hypothetical protein
MATVRIPDDTFERLTERARNLNITVEELINPTLETLTQNGGEALPLKGGRCVET